MDEDIKDTLKSAAIISAVLLVMFLLVIFVFQWLENKTYYYDVEECQNYNGYGYVTGWDGSCNDFFNCEGRCLVYMTDGTKLPLDDFKTMAIKEPMVRK